MSDTELDSAVKRNIKFERIASDLKLRISRVLMEGFWFCWDCDQICERDEGEQGRPAHCSRCKSHRIEYTPPAWLQEVKL